MFYASIQVEYKSLAEMHLWLDRFIPGWEYVDIDHDGDLRNLLENAVKDLIGTQYIFHIIELILRLPCDDNLMLFKLSWPGTKILETTS
jgi:hypothetical protein